MKGIKRKKKTKIKKWEICEGCTKECKFHPNYFDAWKDPFLIPEAKKCSKIKEEEDKMMVIEGNKLSKRCIKCGYDCNDPHRRNGTGGLKCKKPRKKRDERYITQCIENWESKC